MRQTAETNLYPEMIELRPTTKPVALRRCHLVNPSGKVVGEKNGYDSFDLAVKARHERNNPPVKLKKEVPEPVQVERTNDRKERELLKAYGGNPRRYARGSTQHEDGDQLSRY
jgi:hypothetical protein